VRTRSQRRRRIYLLLLPSLSRNRWRRLIDLVLVEPVGGGFFLTRGGGFVGRQLDAWVAFPKYCTLSILKYLLYLIFFINFDYLSY
jgi:hypothetical protein